MLNKIILTISNILALDYKLTSLLIYSIIAGILIKGLSIILKFINKKINLNEKQIYLINKRNKTILTIIFLIMLTIIWRELLKNIITFISFMSAAITLAAREIIYNYFSGIYIKIVKPIKIEDRIKLNDYLGDVININNLNFEILEVNENTKQSTGKIIHIPNSLVFSSPLINYNKGFKYIWDEITISIDINNDIENAKNILLKLISTNSIIKDIPKKMKKEVEKSKNEYRIYYNNYAPIIYTKIEENKCLLTARFLIHPKKQRTVESELYNNIIKIFKQNNITLK